MVARRTEADVEARLETELLLMTKGASPPPYPTAGSVMMIGTGRIPLRERRKSERSKAPSSVSLSFAKRPWPRRLPEAKDTKDEALHDVLKSRAPSAHTDAAMVAAPAFARA